MSEFYSLYSEITKDLIYFTFFLVCYRCIKCKSTLPERFQGVETQPRQTQGNIISYCLTVLFSIPFTVKSLSEALILGSTNPQLDKLLFIDLPYQYMKTTSLEHGENMLCA